MHAQDPIGLAGGLNLYGFAGGDPVNFTDPFGLDCRDRQGNRVPCAPALPLINASLTAVIGRLNRDAGQPLGEAIDIAPPMLPGGRHDMGPVGVVATEETVLRAQIGDDGNVVLGFKGGAMIEIPGLPLFEATAGWVNLGTGDAYLEGNRSGIIPIEAHGNIQDLRFSWKAGWGPLSKKGVVEFNVTFDKDQ